MLRGRFLATFFVLNEHSLAEIVLGVHMHDFAHQGERLIAATTGISQRRRSPTDEEDVLGFLDRAGFEVKLIRYGQWAGNSGRHGPGHRGR